MNNFNLNSPINNAMVQAACTGFNVGSKKQAEKADKEKKAEENISEAIERKFEMEVKKTNKPGGFVG